MQTKKIGERPIYLKTFTLRHSKDIVEIKRDIQKKNDNYYPNNTSGTERCGRVKRGRGRSL